MNNCKSLVTAPRSVASRAHHGPREENIRVEENSNISLINSDLTWWFRDICVPGKDKEREKEKYFCCRSVKKKIIR